jgi:MerR family transcriptional regulator, light-induced transcriptional regulator
MVGYLRIGEFSERVGVSAERLRAWEKRYGLLEPDRSEGGFRLYSDDDVSRVERMLGHIQRGASAAQAARLAIVGSAPPPTPAVEDAPSLDRHAARLREHLERFDDAAVHAELDELLATFSLETVMRSVVLPCMEDIGNRWVDGDMSVAQEHFATNLLRGRLLGLSQGWGQGTGPRAVLATPPGEQHDLALVICGLALSRQGVRVVFLGADCPVDTLVTTVRGMRPALVLLASSEPSTFERVRAELRELGGEVPLHIAGPGASAPLADQLAATYVRDDPVTAAVALARFAAQGVGTSPTSAPFRRF